MAKSKWRRLGVLVIVGSLNLVVVMVVNVAFIYINLRYNSSVLIAAQVMMAVFKIVWNDYVLFSLVALTKSIVLQEAMHFSSTASLSKEVSVLL